DTVGIITTVPAATSVFAFLSKARWRWSGYALVSCSVFILGTCLGFAVLFGVGDANEHHLFYLLFLPIIWVGMRRAADVAVRCRRRAGDGCGEQGGDGDPANTRSARAHV